MKYLILIALLFLAGCSDNIVKPEDVEMANCICQLKTKSNASLIMRSGNIGYEGYSGIQFQCSSGEKAYSHFDKTYTVGCSKFQEDSK